MAGGVVKALQVECLTACVVLLVSVGKLYRPASLHYWFNCHGVVNENYGPKIKHDCEEIDISF